MGRPTSRQASTLLCRAGRAAVEARQRAWEKLRAHNGTQLVEFAQLPLNWTGRGRALCLNAAICGAAAAGPTQVCC